MRRLEIAWPEGEVAEIQAKGRGQITNASSRLNGFREDLLRPELQAQLDQTGWPKGERITRQGDVELTATEIITNCLLHGQDCRAALLVSPLEIIVYAKSHHERFDQLCAGLEQAHRRLVSGEINLEENGRGLLVVLSLASIVELVRSSGLLWVVFLAPGKEKDLARTILSGRVRYS